MALIARIQEGDETALAELYRRLSANVYALALRMLQSREEAEEVLQDTFLKLYRNAERFDPQLGSSRAFIYTIARNEALDRLRARKARPQKAAGWDLHAPSSSMAAASDDPLPRVMLERVLTQLEEEEEQLLQLAFFWGYSHADIAELMSLPLGTVKSKLRRTLTKLRRQLEDHEPS